MNNSNKDIKVLNEEEMEKVNGGGLVALSEIYPTAEAVQYKWNIGDHVEYIWLPTFLYYFTEGATVIDRKPMAYRGGYCASYKIRVGDSNPVNNYYKESEFEGGVAGYGSEWNF